MPSWNITGMKECIWPKRCLASWHTSNWSPHERPDPGFPSRTLPRASHSHHRNVVFPQCILVPSLPQVNNAHVHGRPRDVKGNGTHRIRCPSSTAPRVSSSACGHCRCFQWWTGHTQQGAMHRVLWHIPPVTIVLKILWLVPQETVCSDQTGIVWPLVKSYIKSLFQPISPASNVLTVRNDC